MDIIISSSADSPIYQQIFDQISAQIIKGEIPTGYCLPPIRTVARELSVSVITVKRAWEELERAGFIDSMVGRGCFVKPLPPSALSDKRDALAAERLKKDVAYYKSLGYTLEELIDFVKRFYD